MARYRYNYYAQYLYPPPLQFCFLFVILLFLLGFSWHIHYRYAFEDLLVQIKLMLMVCPVLLLLAVHWLSAEERRHLPFSIEMPEQDYIHRAGGSPWGVGLLLLFLMFMISYRASIHERWFPLLSR